jgi:hypothetical protein
MRMMIFTAAALRSHMRMRAVYTAATRLTKESHGDKASINAEAMTVRNTC